MGVLVIDGAAACLTPVATKTLDCMTTSIATTLAPSAAAGPVRAYFTGWTRNTSS